MDPDKAREIVAAWSQEEFGRLLVVREVNIIRRAAGRVWSAELYCPMREGEILVGTVGVDEKGTIIKRISADDLADAFFQIRSFKNQSPEDPLQIEDDFSDLASESESKTDTGIIADDLEGAFRAIDSTDIPKKIDSLISSGQRENLLEARELLPQLLVHPETRGDVLRQMGELEFILNELDLGINYLEAAAREFSDVADVEKLTQVGMLISQVLGPDGYEESSVKYLLERTKVRMRPIDAIFHAPLFVGLGQEELFHLQGACNLITVEEGEILLNEGEPATLAFVVKTGVLSVRIETGDGGQRVVRSCFPGDFIGESSVLGEEGATCTATVKGELGSELWQFEGERLRELVNEYPDIGSRIESAQTLHRLDSFLSMHEATSTLDVVVRDQLLSSISGIKRYGPGETLNHAGQLPTTVFLVADGKVELISDNGVLREYKVDCFGGLRDTLHELPLEGSMITVNDCLLVCFDPAKLKKIADNASSNVVAVLEKLE